MADGFFPSLTVNDRANPVAGEHERIGNLLVKHAVLGHLSNAGDIIPGDVRFISAPRVFGIRDYFEMIWIYAISTVAKMVKLHTLGNRTILQNPRAFVCSDELSANVFVAVALGFFQQPDVAARRRVHPKTFLFIRNAKKALSVMAKTVLESISPYFLTAAAFAYSERNIVHA